MQCHTLRLLAEFMQLIGIACFVWAALFFSHTRHSRHKFAYRPLKKAHSVAVLPTVCTCSKKIHAAIGTACFVWAVLCFSFPLRAIHATNSHIPRFHRLMALRLPHTACPPPPRRPFSAPCAEIPTQLSQTQPLRGCSSAKGLQVSGILTPLVWRVRRALLRCASPARTRRPRRDASARCRSYCRNRCPCRRCCRCFRSWSRFHPAPLQAGR